MPYSDVEPESGLHCFLCETQCHSKVHNMDTRTSIKQTRDDWNPRKTPSPWLSFTSAYFLVLLLMHTHPWFLPVFDLWINGIILYIFSHILILSLNNILIIFNRVAACSVIIVVHSSIACIFHNFYAIGLSSHFVYYLIMQG